jgi:hypothetical protein
MNSAKCAILPSDCPGDTITLEVNRKVVSESIRAGLRRGFGFEAEEFEVTLGNLKLQVRE